MATLMVIDNFENRGIFLVKELQTGSSVFEVFRMPQVAIVFFYRKVLYDSTNPFGPRQKGLSGFLRNVMIEAEGQTHNDQDLFGELGQMNQVKINGT
jgi:hypothetical protein